MTKVVFFIFRGRLLFVKFNSIRVRMGRLVIGQDMGVVVCCGDDGFSAAPKMLVQLVQLAGAESWTNGRACRGGKESYWLESWYFKGI